MRTFATHRRLASVLVLILIGGISCGTSHSGQNQVASPSTATPRVTLLPTKTRTPSSTLGDLPVASDPTGFIKPVAGKTTQIPYFDARGPWLNLSVPVGTQGAPHMVVDSAGRVWVGNDGGVSVFINGDEENWPAWVTYTVADGLPSPRINDLVIDDKNHIWAATDKGVVVFDGIAWVTYDVSAGLTRNHVSSLAIGPEGVVWANASGQLHRWDGQAWTPIEGTLLPSSPIVIDAAGHLWGIDSADSVSRYDGSSWTTYTRTREGLMDFFSSGNGQDRFPLYGPLDTLHSDSEGHIWIGAGRYGVADGAQPASYERQFVSYDGSTWQSLFCRAQETGAFYCGVPYPPSGSDSAALAPIVVLKHGVITGEYDQIMDHLAGDIMSVALDPLGRSWIGTTRGLSVKAAEMFQPARDEVSVVYHDVSAYSPGGTHVYDPGVLPWLDLLVRLDDEWYGPERQVGDEIGAYPLDQAGAFRWEASGAFSTLPNGEAWWNESGNQGIVTLYDPDHKSVYSVALEIRFKNDPMYESVAQVQPSDSPACDILADGLELRPHDSPPLTKSWLVEGMRLTPLARDLDGTSLQVQLPTGQVGWLSADLGSLDCGRLNLDHLPVSESASHGTYRATSSAFKAWVTDLQPGSKSYNLQLHNTGNALFVTYAEAISIVDNLGNHYEPDCLQMACGQLWIGNNIPFQLSGTLKQPIDPSATRVILSLAVQEPPDVGPSDYVLIWQQDIALQIWQLDR